jgi:2-phosphosulfolactate phosphatase
VRFEWGRAGLEAIGPGSDVIVIVDVLSFSTCVDVATSRGAVVLPFRWRDETAAAYAIENGALLAGDRQPPAGGYSLSPASLERIRAGTRLVLPSPNGSALSLMAATYGITLTACLRNGAAVAAAARRLGHTVAVIACGEKWPDGGLRPAWEDLVGVGAVVAGLTGARSPEARSARAAFRQAEAKLPRLMRRCASGRGLIGRGFAADVELAAAAGVSATVPRLEGKAFVASQA